MTDEESNKTKGGEQMAKELQAMKAELESLSVRRTAANLDDDGLTTILRYMVEERERTNKILADMISKINKLERALEEAYSEEERVAYAPLANNRELPLSNLDSKIINFVQSRGMACADEVKEAMRYKGRNAACARLNKLYREGLLDRFQLGRKVYYKFDAGKVTNTLIISPPQ